MMNIIRADIYRLFRGKGLYITLVVFLAVVMAQAIGSGNIMIGINYDTVDTIQNIDSETDMTDLSPRPTGAEAPFRAMTQSDTVLYFLIPLLTLTTVVDFSSGAAKNTLASGVSRGTYYASKLIFSCAIVTLMLVTMVLLATLANTIINGFGGTLDKALFSGVMKIFLPQLWLCLAAACAANFFIFILRSGSFVGVYIAYLFAPMLFLLLSLVHSWFNNLFDYDLIMNIGKLAYFDMLTPGEITRALMIGTIHLLAAVFSGFLLFRKAEIK